MINKIIIGVILIVMIVSTLAPAFAFAKGQMEPPDRNYSLSPVESTQEEIEQVDSVTDSFTDYDQKIEITLDNLLRVYPDTVDDPTAVVIGYKLTSVDMPVTFPFYVLVNEEKNTYNATELGLSPVLWKGDDYVTKAWVGMEALKKILGSEQKLYFSTINEIRFIIPN